jgi:hypothetical protein
MCREKYLSALSQYFIFPSIILIGSQFTINTCWRSKREKSSSCRLVAFLSFCLILTHKRVLIRMICSFFQRFIIIHIEWVNEKVYFICVHVSLCLLLFCFEFEIIWYCSFFSFSKTLFEYIISTTIDLS